MVFISSLEIGLMRGREINYSRRQTYKPYGFGIKEIVLYQLSALTAIVFHGQKYYAGFFFSHFTSYSQENCGPLTYSSFMEPGTKAQPAVCY